jgi:copper chaperone CopZ
MTANLQQSTFTLPKMDCSSEENLVRMALGGKNGIKSLSFDLQARQLKVVHTTAPDQVLAALQPLNLGAALQGSAPAPAPVAVRKTLIAVPKMDCSSEENLVRMALADEKGIGKLSFDLHKRELTAVHEGAPDRLLTRLQPLNLGARLVSSDAAEAGFELLEPDDDPGEAKTLKVLLAINAAMFVFELVLGLVAQSTGLIADSLDMFADAAVYGVALMAVGTAASRKVKAAHFAGWLQVLLALFALAEVIRRAVFGSEPESSLMMGVGLVALMANVACLMLISKKKESGAHMKASYIFSANDVIANMGVIVAGALVAWTGSSIPDLVIGTVIAAVVLNGARRILKLK